MKTTFWTAASALFACAWLAQGEISVTKQPFPGVLTYSEVRTNPPNRLFVAEVDLEHPDLRLRVSRGGPDPDGPGEWQTTLMQPTRIAARDEFDLVVNGDFYRILRADPEKPVAKGYQSQVWSAVIGPAASAGQVWSTSASGRPCLVVTTNRQVRIELLAEPRPDHAEVVAGNRMLVEEGVAVEQTSKARHPRTVAGLNKDRTRLVLLVVDGRKPGIAAGMNYDELAAEMVRLGCWQALNLDGGGSSVIAVREQDADTMRILNQPTDGRERPVANVLGIIHDEDSPRVRQKP